jgi:hypothetical protein
MKCKGCDCHNAIEYQDKRAGTKYALCTDCHFGRNGHKKLAKRNKSNVV